jgi:hypothetical protein
MLLSGCFTTASYEALTKPNRPQRAGAAIFCAVKEDGERVSARVVLKLEDGRRWLVGYDATDELQTQMLPGREVARNPKVENARRCVQVQELSDMVLGKLAWHFGSDGAVEKEQRPITHDDFVHAAVLAYEPGATAEDPTTLMMLVPPPDGRTMSELDERSADEEFAERDRCLGCRRASSPRIAADVAGRNCCVRVVAASVPARRRDGGLAVLGNHAKLGHVQRQEIQRRRVTASS